MKSRFIKMLLAILGFGSMTTACFTAEYGCPNADYEVRVGTYTEEGEAIMGLKVSIVEGAADTIGLGLTNKYGEYVFKHNGFPERVKVFTIGIDDIDGTAHLGEFKSESVRHAFAASDLKGGDGNWYSGRATASYDFHLKEKATEEEQQ